MIWTSPIDEEFRSLLQTICRRKFASLWIYLNLFYTGRHGPIAFPLGMFGVRAK